MTTTARSGRARNWCFTINNPGRKYCMARIWLACERLPDVRYCVYQKEMGEEGTQHIQGYIELKKPQWMRWLKDNFAYGAHYEQRKGTRWEARAYCMKEESRICAPVEYGSFVACGERTDLEDIKIRIAEGENIKTIVEDCTSYQQARFAEKLYSIKTLSKEYRKKEVFWYWGTTGTGKTRAAFERSGEDYWLSNLTGEWFDGYTGQKDVIIDDLRAKAWPYVLLLRLLDGYPLRVPVKGGFTVWEPERIWITCPLSPENLYQGQLNYQGDIDQLTRRIDVCTEFTHH